MKQIELANGKGFALVDDEDYERLNGYRWYLGNSGYAGRTTKGRGGRKITMHREVLGLAPGDKKQADHINGNRLDNRRRNLRECSHEENRYNVQKTKGLSSGYKGVSRDGQQWQVKITHNRTGYHLGLFDSETEAAIAYDHEARKLFGEFAKLNFPDIDRPAQGRIELTPKGKSKYFGVYWSVGGSKWTSRIKIQGKTYHLGQFENEEDAAHAFDDAARKHRGRDTRTNFH